MTTTTSIQTLVDGPRNVVIKYEGTLTAIDTGKVVVVNPALLSDYDINGVKASKLRIDTINYDVEDLLTVNLLWGDTTAADDKIIWNLTGRGCVKAKKFGGIVNNAASPTGTIKSSFDYEGTSQLLTFTIILELVKQG